MYRVKAQGYGGSGPSIKPFESLDINKIKCEIEDLLTSDHSVQLYKIEADGSEISIPFEYYTYTKCEIPKEFKE